MTSPASGAAPVARRYHLHIPGLVYIGVVLLLAVGAINSQNNLLFAALGLAVGGLLVSGIISGASLLGLRLERDPIGHAAVGAPLVVAYTIRNTNRFFPAFGLSIAEVPEGEPTGWERRMPPVRAFAAGVAARRSVRAEASIVPTRRGRVDFNQVLVWTTFPFGLARKSVTFELPATGAVRPVELSLRRDVLDRLSAPSPLGGGAERQPGQGDEFFSLREYTPGDSVRRIAWRRSARTGDLIVRQQAAPAPLRLWVLLNVASLEGARLERAVALGASVVRAAAAGGMAVGLVAPGATRPPRIGARHVDLLICDLALLEPSAPVQVPALAGRSGASVVIGEGDAAFAPIPAAARKLSGGSLESLVVGGEAPGSRIAMLAGAGVGAMNAVRAFQRCAAALSLLGITSYITSTFATFEPALGIAIVGLPAVAVAWWFSIRRGVLYPRWVVNGMLLLAVAYAAMRASSSRVTVEVIAELVVFIEFIKLGDRRSPRDDAQIISLTVFLGIAAMLTSNDLWVGLQLIAFIPLLIATVMLFQVHSGWHSAGRPAPAPVIRGPFRRTVAVATAGTLGLTLFVFIIMPRGVGEDFLGNLSLTVNRGRTAFTDHVKLGSMGMISQSSRIVLNMSVHQVDLNEDALGTNLGGPETVFYLRGAVLREEPTAPGTFSVTPSRRRTRRPVATSEDIVIIQGVRGHIRQDIALSNAASTRATLFSLWRPVKFGVGRGEYEHDAGEGTMRRSGSGGVVNYTVWSSGMEPQTSGPGFRSGIIEGRAGPIKDLAVSLVTGAGLSPDPSVRPIDEDVGASRAIQNYLHQNYRYTLEAQAIPSRVDPVEHFLFQSSEGHCEYFAAAMVRMCRSVGINARMIAGYVAAEYSEASGRYVVRESNVHAWVEVEVGPDQWRRFDPTPPADLVRLHQGRTGLFARLRQAMESVEYAWNTGVVGFDEGARQRLFGPIGVRRTGILGFFDSVGERLQNGGPRIFLRALAAGIGVFLVVWLAGTGVRWVTLKVGAVRDHRRRQLFPALAGLPPARRNQLRFYIRHLDLLRKRGHPKPDWKPPLVHASAIGATDPKLGAQSAGLSGVYYRATFGGAELSAQELEEAERILREMSAHRS